MVKMQQKKYNEICHYHINGLVLIRCKESTIKNSKYQIYINPFLLGQLLNNSSKRNIIIKEIQEPVLNINENNMLLN